MSLTRGGGPLSSPPGPQTVNYAIDGPKHRLYLHPFPRRVRAELGGETVLDTTGGFLLHESNLGPVLYVPREDVTGELEPTDHSTHCPFKGDASYWTLRAGGEERENAVWAYLEPLEAARWLDGLVAFYPDKLDAWYDEDERIRGRLRDPYHRVDARRSSRTVTITRDGEVLAQSTRAIVLSETGLANRWYLPREDVRVELTPSAKVTHCPYKGDTTYFDVPGTADAAWSYEAPMDGVTAIAGLVCFEADGIAVQTA